MIRQVKCPTCGNVWPVAPAASAAADARQAAHRAKIAQLVEQRAQRDLTAWTHVPELFVARQVGEAMRAAGRHWSEHQGAMGRAERLGWVALVARVMIGRRECKLWRKTAKLHKLALKVSGRGEKGLTRPRRRSMMVSRRRD